MQPPHPPICIYPCHHLARFLSDVFQAHHPTSPLSSSVESPGLNQVPSVSPGILLSQQLAPSYLASSNSSCPRLLPTPFFQHTPRLIHSTSTPTYSIYSRPDLYLKPEFTKKWSIWSICFYSSLRPLTHALENGSRNWHHKFNTRFLVPIFCANALLLTSLTASGTWRQSMTSEVVHWHEKLVPKSGFKFRPIASISEACVSGIKLSSQCKKYLSFCFHFKRVLFNLNHELFSVCRRLDQLRLQILQLLLHHWYLKRTDTHTHRHAWIDRGTHTHTLTQRDMERKWKFHIAVQCPHKFLNEKLFTFLLRPTELNSQHWDASTITKWRRL